MTVLLSIQMCKWLSANSQHSLTGDTLVMDWHPIQGECCDTFSHLMLWKNMISSSWMDD